MVKDLSSGTNIAAKCGNVKERSAVRADKVA
jgi:hypothetical protein